MNPGLLATKVGMTRILSENGPPNRRPCSRRGRASFCRCVPVRRMVTTPLQLGFEDVKPHRSTKALIGHCGKAGTGPKKAIQEVRLREAAQVSPATC